MDLICHCSASLVRLVVLDEESVRHHPPTRNRFAINLKTMTALNLHISTSLLALADVVIE